jgi:hypothetical protein
MTIIHLTRNPDLVNTLCEHYFVFRRRKTIRESILLKGYLILFIVFLASYFLSGSPILLIASFISMMALPYWLIRFAIVKRKILTALKLVKTTEYDFGYSEEGLYYKADGIETKTEWTYYSYYETNGVDLYIYDKSGKRMTNIISEKISGAVHFEEIKRLIESHLKKR